MENEENRNMGGELDRVIFKEIRRVMKIRRI